MKIIQSIFKTFLLSLMMITDIHIAYAQSGTASVLPNAKTVFLDANGKPLVSGKVNFYIPGTTTRKTTWQDSGETTPNSNPVTLDGAGRALILGDGSYRQVVFDRNGNLIWDANTSSTGSGGGGGIPTVGDGDLVGMVKPWAGLIAPTQYVFSYGQELVRANFTLAYSTLTTQQNVSCTTGVASLTGLTDTSNIPIGAPVESTCLNSGATVISKTISTVGTSSTAIISSTAPAVFFPYGNGDGSTTFNVPDLRGKTVAGRCNMGGVSCSNLTSTYFGVNPNGLSTGGTESKSNTLIVNNLPAYTPSGTIVTTTTLTTNGAVWFAAGANNVNTGGSGINLNPSVLTASSVSTFSGAAQGGVSTPIVTSAIQPTQLLNYIIKVLPDTNANTFFGVASVGGMQGVLTCGTGIVCSGNNISAVASAPSNAVFTPKTYGALCDAVQIASSSVSITSGSPNLTVTGATFALSDVGKVISITQAGTTVSGIKGTLNTTIMAFVDVTHVTLTNNAGTTVSAAAQTVTYFTDDTAAFNTAAAVAPRLDMAGLKCGITATVTFTVPTRLSGNGAGSVLYFRQTSGTTAKTVIQLGTGSDYWSAYNLYFDADSGGQLTVNTSASIIDGASAHPMILSYIDINGNGSAQVKSALSCVNDLSSNSEVDHAIVHGCINVAIGSSLHPSHLKLTNNYLYGCPITTNASSCLLVTTIGGVAQSDIIITGNTIDMSDQTIGTLGNAIAVLGDVSNPITGVNISNNVITGVANTTIGTGILTTNSKNCVYNNNIVYHFGSNYSANCINGTFDSNVLVGGGTYGIETSGLNIVMNNNIIYAETFSAFGIQANGCNHCSGVGNYIDGTSAPNAFVGISHITPAASTNDDITINSNTIIIPATGTGQGIQVVCTSTAVCVRYVVTGNLIDGGTTGSIGIQFNGSGTQTNIMVGPNKTAQDTGIKISSGWTSVCLLPGLNTSSTPTSNSGSASSCL